MTHYIYSTHTNAIKYVEYEKNTSKNHSVIKKSFIVLGGHGLCNKNFITPIGVVTTVDKDSDFEWLMQLPEFLSDIDKGFIRVQKSKVDSEKVVKRDMNPKDGSAPKVPSDYKANTGSNVISLSSNVSGARL